MGLGALGYARLSFIGFASTMPERCFHSLLLPTVLVSLFFCGGIQAASSLSVEKLVPFATADSLRFTAELAGEFAEPVNLEGAIQRVGSKEIFWNGKLSPANVRPGQSLKLENTIRDLRPALWEPAHPVLYEFTLRARTASGNTAEKKVRFGFRSFESVNGQLRLNGRPIFLRGIAINPPGRTIPDEVGKSREFAEAYVRFLKSQNVNTIRMTYDSQAWFDVCDELGMMVYQGQYGSPLGSAPKKQEPPTDFNDSMARYKSLFETYAAHPSILIYILSNELPTHGTRGAGFHEYLTKACAELKKCDATRLYIGNAGYGEGREGDICDVHRYWGWYYNTFLTYYNLRERFAYGEQAKNQPLTFTECVGNFTGWNGEYNIILKKQLGAQLNWTGHSAEQAQDATAYQCFMVKQATETFRRLRPINPRLSGIMPFTILFDNWSGITNFAQMHAKPAMRQMAKSYQPVLLSWEVWTPQVYAGRTIRPIAHVINDSDAGENLEAPTLRYWLRLANAPASTSRLEERITLPSLPYYGTWRKQLSLQLPADLPTGEYVLAGEVRSGDRVVSRNEQPLFVANAQSDWGNSPEGVANPARVSLYDPRGGTAQALKHLGVPYKAYDAKSHDATSGPKVLVIGEDAWKKRNNPDAAELKRFVAAGGRIVCLQQPRSDFDTSWLPEQVSFFTSIAHDTTYPPASRPFSGNMNINPERADHPVFQGLDRHRLAVWSDYTGWDQTKRGFPRVYPVTGGFKLTEPESLKRTAVIADYDRGLEGIALAEMFSGNGSVILCGFDLVRRIGLDPAADRLLLNLIAYAGSPEPHAMYPLIKGPIEWGNYATEHGAIAGSANGIVVNADWVRPPTNPHATPLTQDEGAWNTKPGDLFLPHGRRLFGPYGYSTGTSIKDLNPDSDVGTGFFCAQIPPGKKTMKTLVENRDAGAAELHIVVNEAGADTHATILGKRTAEFVTPLVPGTTNVCVSLKGSKSLVLLKTDFE
jgi:beta-galactosidase